MRTSFHHQPEAQHPNLQRSTRRPADYPIYRTNTGHRSVRGLNCSGANEPTRSYDLLCREQDIGAGVETATPRSRLFGTERTNAHRVVARSIDDVSRVGL